jgi:ATP-binding cassette subfamily F protein uup
LAGGRAGGGGETGTPAGGRVAGEVAIGARTQINYVDQDRLLLDDNKTIYAEVGEGGETVRLGEESISLRAYLRRFLFSEERINSRIAQLSGGERSRVLLAKILKRGGNVLILDEPTNDLDLGTLRLLEEALCAFAGSVIVVSHDRYFLNRVCTSILAFEGDGVVRYQVGNYDYYCEKRVQETAVVGRRSLHRAQSRCQTAQPDAVSQRRPADSTKRPEKPRKMKWKEERELESMESTILAAEEAEGNSGGWRAGERRMKSRVWKPNSPLHAIPHSEFRIPNFQLRSSTPRGTTSRNSMRAGRNWRK